MEQYVLPNSGHSSNPEASKLGMWLFLFTELLLFGGLFLVYMVYRALNPEAFLIASYELNITMGTINTVVLLTSSLTIAMSISALQKGKKGLALYLMLATIAFSLIFMVIKFFEWNAKIHHGLFPGMEHYQSLPHGESLFFFLYFFMTGLHALHVIIGAIFIGIVVVKVGTDEVTGDQGTLLENSGLYWHLVDIIWIYLFPLFYLIH
ncbi:MAG: cytochrome c oxidase subunit 3 [Bacteroidales bacterium]|nr:cytochrome c oxidase subunit 3 [Bacteroidales bacterium]MCF8349548.1 cytochrome c oxidase subunit 3 [Bacteroidales bacterium]MCF8375107.1 cytochrome c oxidase subunit 3 [Bacteroidales bacterium]MCF8400014.1 cytochrome c oxidase subunit 3 [Bacteroidales bacterium]